MTNEGYRIDEQLVATLSQLAPHVPAGSGRVVVSVEKCIASEQLIELLDWLGSMSVSYVELDGHSSAPEESC